MDTSWLTWAIPVGLVAAFLLLKRVGQIGSDAARQLVKDGAKLIDVRSEAEFASGHLPGAVNVPLQELGAKAGKLGAKDKPLVLYAQRDGPRAAQRARLHPGLQPRGDGSLVTPRAPGEHT